MSFNHQCEIRMGEVDTEVRDYVRRPRSSGNIVTDCLPSFMSTGDLDREVVQIKGFAIASQ